MKNKKILYISSFTNPKITYLVDLDNRTCSCPAFRKRPTTPCKHLLSIDGLFPAQQLPTASDAVSAFIKSVRLRYTEDAAFWLTYLWQSSKERSRAQRRILYESGEDNISVDVIERVGEWFGSPQKRSLESAITEVLRICATKNWWAHPDGRRYIYSWRTAELASHNFSKASLQELFEIMHTAIHEKTLIRGLAAFNAIYKRREFRPKMLSQLLLDWAHEFGSQQGLRLAKVYDQHASAFWLDTNVSGQTYYAIIHGEFGRQVSPEVSHQEVERYLVQAQQKLMGDYAVPRYAQDGVHTKSGSDKRFAGVVKFMSGSCRAFEHYGRLSPDDEWFPEFMEVPDVE